MKNSSYAEAELERSVEEQDLLSWHRVLVQRWITFWRGEEVVSEVIPSKKGREWEELAGPLKAGGSVNRNSYEMMR